MKYSQAQPGRIFVIRLENGDIVHEVIESFAREHAIGAATLVILGGADKGSRLVVGPEDGQSKPVIPMGLMLENVHEAAGVGTLFPDFVTPVSYESTLSVCIFVPPFSPFPEMEQGRWYRHPSGKASV